MAKGIKRKIIAARDKVNYEISQNAKRNSMAGAMASEGYAGGYRDALNDVLLLLNDVTPNRRDYYENEY